MKTTVCFIGHSESTCRFISGQLLRFLKEYIDVRTWCLNHTSNLPDNCISDIYLVSTVSVYNLIKDQIPANKKVMIAARTIHIENLDRLLAIEPGTRAIVVGTTLETAQMAIDIIKSFGIHYLDLIPYYPGVKTVIPGNVQLAISTGLNHLAPPQVAKVVDLGAKGLDLSTFVELTQLLRVSKEVLNEISHYYIEAILHISLKLQKIARVNEELKRNMEVILATVNEAIIAVDQSETITLLNPEAEKLLEINSANTIGRPVREVLPQVDLSRCLQYGENIIHDISRIADNYFIISANPTTNGEGCCGGAVITLRPVDEVQEMETKVRRTLRRKGNEAKHSFGEIIGASPGLKRAVDLAKKFAKTELTVLIEGESGTGKELFAQAIHNHSLRRNSSFVALNFAALPENLVESELFGYEDGAFTGAKKGGKPGLFEEAHLGTIFLDEIGDATLSVQKKLLRVLEEREVRRVGGSNVTPVDVRVIAATNQNLELLVRRGEFRSDLYYRLCTLPITVPPLRERDGDSIRLIQYFAKKQRGTPLMLEPPLQEFLLQYSWPGNIREMQNVVNYLCSVVPPNAVATIKDLPAYVGRSQGMPVVEKQDFRPYSDMRFETIIKELKNQKLLDVAVVLLGEIKQATAVNQGMGRQALVKRLDLQQASLPEHKIRYWLKAFSKMGYIDSGVTRQGSRITKEGEELLAFLEKQRDRFPAKEYGI
jgi:transcriptional regulator with PAS, ATPase and Fis domain